MIFIFISQPFAEQKELVASLADKGANLVNGCNSNAPNNSESSDNKDVYELYGVVNHIGKILYSCVQCSETGVFHV